MEAADPDASGLDIASMTEEEQLALAEKLSLMTVWLLTTNGTICTHFLIYIRRNPIGTAAIPLRSTHVYVLFFPSTCTRAAVCGSTAHLYHI